MEATPVGQITFDEFSLDGQNACLWRGRERIPLTPKPFALLWHFAEHSGQLRTKDELLRVVWPDTVAGEASLTVCIHDLRKILGDHFHSPRFIETVHRRGYRFLPAVALVAPPLTAASAHLLPSFAQLASAGPPERLLDPVLQIAELQQLRNWLEGVLRSERRIVIVVNESGLGATALDGKKEPARSLRPRGDIRLMH